MLAILIKGSSLIKLMPREVGRFVSQFYAVYPGGMSVRRRGVVLMQQLSSENLFLFPVSLLCRTVWRPVLCLTAKKKWQNGLNQGGDTWCTEDEGRGSCTAALKTLGHGRKSILEKLLYCECQIKDIINWNTSNSALQLLWYAVLWYCMQFAE